MSTVQEEVTARPSFTISEKSREDVVNKELPQSDNHPAPSEDKKDDTDKETDKDETDKDDTDKDEAVSDEDKTLELSSDLSFKKKDVKKPRAQSIQSVLSTASLKSLKYQAPPGPRTSMVSNTDKNQIHPNSSSNNLKNFQSFIQAPVLLCITNLKSQDDVQIGQQLPFDDKKQDGLVSSASPDNKLEALAVESADDDYDDHDTILQQQRLTINALKKLSLSLMPIVNEDIRPRRISKTESKTSLPLLDTNLQPYQPAAVDLSSFASLTRQPKPKIPDPVTPVTPLHEPAPPIQPIQQARRPDQPPQQSLTQRRPAADPLSVATANYHQEVRQTHINNLRQLAVAPPPEMSSRRQQDPLKEKHLQQIKGFRSPMYIPAVLRKTQHLDGSAEPDYTHEVDRFASTTTSSRASLRSFDSGVSTDLSPPSPPFNNGGYNLHKQYEHIVKSAPTRKHWLKDESAAKCGISNCPKYFNFFERRHHCRKCGGIFCKEHTSHYLYINHLAQFTTGGRGTLSKVCDNCINEYNTFINLQFGVCKPGEPRKLPEPVAASVPPVTEAPKGSPVKTIPSVGTLGTRTEQLAGSVPANWSWSSF